MNRNAVRRKFRASIDMTPMIDIVFQLVLFFLVSTTFSFQPGIQLELPESSTAESVQAAGLVVSVAADGAAWLNGAAVPAERLAAALAEFSADGVKKEELPVLLELDAQVPAGTLVEILDAVRAAGYHEISLRTAER
ncbi:MAG: biopolymer transporter ExbD [Treponemataceae bacterium]|nr:biopolymer transporter ExbD [Treponemataceae bacterium]